MASFLNSLVVLGNGTEHKNQSTEKCLNLSNMQWLPSINMKLLLLLLFKQVL